jgi:predicted anti-sigma-YlaC factor YlaD
MNEQVEQLSCQELVELVTDYLEGALTDEARLRFEEHIGLCEGCRIYLEQMRQTITVLGHLPEEALSPDAERKLLEAFRGWRSA